MPASVLVRATRAREDDVKFKQIWNIWYPPIEEYSFPTHYSLEKAKHQLNNAIEKNDEFRGMVNQDRITLRHVTWLYGRKYTILFNGSWRESTEGVTLQGRFSQPALGPLFITIALLLVYSIEVLVFATLAGHALRWIFHSIDTMGPSHSINWPTAVIMVGFPPIVLAIATGILAQMNAGERERKQKLLSLIRRALK